MLTWRPGYAGSDYKGSIVSGAVIHVEGAV